jgi:hypothetical protein
MKTYTFSIPMIIWFDPEHLPATDKFVPKIDTHLNIQVQAKDVVEATEQLQVSLQQIVDERLQSTSMRWRKEHT